jgi:phosphate transport system permease protein
VLGAITVTQTLTIVLFLGLIPLAAFGYRLGRGKRLAQSATPSPFAGSAGIFGWYAVLGAAKPALAINLAALGLYLAGILSIPMPVVAASTVVAAMVGLFLALRAIQPHFRAREAIEKTIQRMLFVASLISILTTIGIVASVIFEAIHFFRLVSLWEFITGTQWNPDDALRPDGTVDSSLFGAVPLFAGTLLITCIAMSVAIPVGLFSAICMSEYASPLIRRIAKPTLEILAGIPTVVYGFFAAITVSPLVVETAGRLGLQADSTNALSPGLVMGIMIIPLVSSLADDVISAVPQNLREGSLALGAFPSETIKRVVLPAALPGIVSACLLAVSRAVGETMIVVMAAGLQPVLSANPLRGMTTVNVRIVDAFTGDQAFDSPETLSAFGLGLALLVITLGLNIISLTVIRKFRQRYE